MGATRASATSSSPDGTRLIVPGSIDGVVGLHAVATDGGGAVLVPTTAGRPIDFAGTATGAIVVPPGAVIRNKGVSVRRSPAPRR